MNKKEHISEIFGQTVASHRKKLGLSQEQLAEKASCHRTYVGAVERGERNITIVCAERLAKALGLELHELLKFDFKDARK